MSTTISSEEFVDDFLEHYGVKGMRWGHRKPEDSGSGSSGGSTRSAPKAKKKEGLGARIEKAVVKVGERDARIEKARINVEKRQNKIKATKKQMKRDTRMFSADRKAGRNNIRNMKLDLLSNPDKATAMRMTSGEMFAQAMFGNVGVITAQNRAANLVERRAATGYYKAKKRK